MKLPKIMIFGTVSLFAIIAVIGIAKGKKHSAQLPLATSESIEEIPIEPIKEQLPSLKNVQTTEHLTAKAGTALAEKAQIETAKAEIVQARTSPAPSPSVDQSSTNMVLTESEESSIDRIDLLFTTDASKLPIVETITYTSRVPWLKGRPAWITDYASYYETTRHFIARSLNRNKDYFTQKVSPGDRFNVLRKDKPIEFHLLIELNQCKLWFYAIDKQENTRYLLKTYHVGLGRKDSKRTSGYLTPLGKFSLGSKVAVYRPGDKGYFQDQKIEMIRIFGTRWIPFEKELSGCSDIAKGLGLHGVPWLENPSGQLIEDLDRVGRYDSDGCIRLASEDIEEIFAIVISKPTTIELVKSYSDAQLPGEEPTNVR